MTARKRYFYLFTILILFKLSALSSDASGLSCKGLFNSITSKAPWQMTANEWLKSGSPDYSISFSQKFWRSKDSIELPPWEMSMEAEIKAINEFTNTFSDPLASFRLGGGVNGEPSKVKSYRQEDFARSWHHQFVTHLPEHTFKLEDAREAILVGRKLGYSDQDILWYLVRNHIIGSFAPELWKAVAYAGWGNHQSVLKGTPIPEKIKKLFPNLFGKADTFY